MFAQSIMTHNNKTIKKMKKSINTKTFLVILLGSFILALLSSCSDDCVEVVCVERASYVRTSVTTVDLSGMTEDVEIKSQGNDSEYQTTGDLNLNGFKLRLVNVQLTVVGNMNGNGTGGGSQVSTLGTSTVCVQGSIQNNPEYNSNDFECGSLSSGGVTGVYEGQLEVGCGEVSTGDLFRSGNLWYEVVPCD